MSSLLKQYLEEARRHEEIRKGNVSPENIEKMKKSGAIKSEEDYLKGYDKGTDNIIKKHGVVVKKTSKYPGYNRLARTAYMPADDSEYAKKYDHDEYKKDKPILKRHEAYEASDKKKKGKIKFTRYGITGEHRSPKVLEKEKRDVDYASRVHGIGNRLKDIRQSNGEYTDLANLSKTKIRKMVRDRKTHNLVNGIERKSLTDRFKDKIKNVKRAIKKKLK